jgi:aminoacylase
LELNVPGNTGHGSRFIEKTAAEKLQRLINKFLGFREEQKKILHSNCSCMKLGDITSVNLTMIKGGIAQNIVPSEFNVTFDIRVAPPTDIKEFEEKIKSWIAEAEGQDGDSGKITYNFLAKKGGYALTSRDETVNPYWGVFKKSCNEMNLKLAEEIFPGGTDSRFLREIGIPAFGFSPISNTPILLHDHNEFLNAKVFLNGVDIMHKIVLDLANMD